VRLSPAGLKNRIRNLDLLRMLPVTGFHGKVFLVGGALRELAIGQSPNDYDFALERAEDLKIFEALLDRPSFLLGKKPTQTHRIAYENRVLDITLLDGTIEQDLLRRDFTINAMAYDLREEAVLDPLDGLRDIGTGTIRYPREESIREDPLRMIKAVRHLSCLAGFAIDPQVKATISARKELVRHTAPERIKYELDLIMLSRDNHKGIRTLEETGLLFEIFPELLRLREMDREKGLELEALGHTLGGFKHFNRIRRFHPFNIQETKWAAYGLLFHDLGKPLTFSYDEEKRRVHFFHHERHSRTIAEGIMERLRFSSAEMRSILNLIESHMRIFLISTSEATERATRRLVYRTEHLTPGLVFLTLLDLYGSSKGKENASTRRVRTKCREILAAYEEWRKEPLPRIITGKDLIVFGFAEGPAIGKVLHDIREKQIAGEMTSREEALEYARAFLPAIDT
jgi:poly(A) polymerase